MWSFVQIRKNSELNIHSGELVWFVLMLWLHNNLKIEHLLFLRQHFYPPLPAKDIHPGQILSFLLLMTGVRGADALGPFPFSLSDLCTDASSPGGDNLLET